MSQSRDLSFSDTRRANVQIPDPFLYWHSGREKPDWKQTLLFSVRCGFVSVVSDSVCLLKCHYHSLKTHRHATECFGEEDTCSILSDWLGFFPPVAPCSLIRDGLNLSVCQILEMLSGLGIWVGLHRCPNFTLTSKKDRLTDRITKPEGWSQISWA